MDRPKTNGAVDDAESSAISPRDPDSAQFFDQPTSGAAPSENCNAMPLHTHIRRSGRRPIRFRRSKVSRAIADSVTPGTSGFGLLEISFILVGSLI